MGQQRVIHSTQRTPKKKNLLSVYFQNKRAHAATGTDRRRRRENVLYILHTHAHLGEEDDEDEEELVCCPHVVYPADAKTTTTD
jgi:hypothetical protein